MEARSPTCSRPCRCPRRPRQGPLSFPSSAPVDSHERSEPHLAEGPYLLVGVADLPQGRDDVASEVGDVAGDKARLPLGDEARLAYGGGQDTRLGAPELLDASPVLDPHWVAHAGEGQAAFGVGRLRMGAGQRPAFEGEVRARAAEDAPRRAILQDESGVRAGQVVRLQLVEGCVYVRAPGLLVEWLAVEVGRRDELAEVRGLLDLEDQGVRPEGVKDPARYVHGVARPYGVAGHHGVVVSRLERLEELLAPEALFYAGQNRRVLGGPEDVPRLGLAVGLAVLLARRRVVGVEVDGEHVRGVEELLEEREVRAAPSRSDQFLGELDDEVVERASGVLAVRYLTRGLLVIAYLPGLGDDAVRGVPLAQHLWDQALPEVVGAHVVGWLYRVGVHTALAAALK